MGAFTKLSETCLLHCGISDSHGAVYNFDERGRRRQTNWRGSLCIPLEHAAMSDAAWDAALRNFNQREKTSGGAYSALTNNCYAYVVGFLNTVAFQNSRQHRKTDLATKMIAAPLNACQHWLDTAKQVHAGAGVFIATAKQAKPSTKDTLSTLQYVCDFCDKLISNRTGHYKCAACPGIDMCHACRHRSNAQHNASSHQRITVSMPTT
jgi:hypothetical protein